ncbi:MAG TPA: bifunctional serine/threonine-protein kinase/formylglycine-generating enzyme family protein [Polyangia bacterium]|nr:bifunctional serine/threonine-protein kinase/formylglycine-generating enzyme family protein [Polyangia bacterium]
MNQPAGQIAIETGSVAPAQATPTVQTGSLDDLRQGVLLAGRYRIVQPVARGGCAMVFRAVDEHLGETVAIKVLLPQGGLGEVASRVQEIGIRSEAISSMRLSHPKILRVYNYERHPPWEFLVMEYVDGTTLKLYQQSRQTRRLEPRELLRVGLDCLEALDYAHGAGVIHNDIKPSNVLVTRSGTLKLCDFGLAHLASAAPAARKSLVAGTPNFMSPERIRGEPGDARSDLYSLAATLYLLGNGQPLFCGDEKALHGHLHLPPPPSPHLPAELDQILQVALAKDPQARFQTAHEMREALVGLSRGQRSGRVTGSRSVRVPAEPPPPPPDAAPSGHTCEISSSMVMEREAREADAAEMAVIEPVTLRSVWARGEEFTVAGFLLDRTPVTNAEYQVFVTATGETPPAHWLGDRPPPSLEDHPVVGVTLAEARRYAAWRGKRLPTALEWEAAARGAEGRSFPWGEEWEAHRCQGPEQGGGSTAPVDGHPEGASPEGCLDLIGNVWEWTEPDPDVKVAPAEGYAWVMGGSYRHACVQDGHIARTQVSIYKAYDYLGFRCAMDLPGADGAGDARDKSRGLSQGRHSGSGKAPGRRGQ